MYVWKQNVTYRYGMCIHITFMLWYSVSDGVPVKWFDCVTFILLIYRCLLRGHGIWVLLCKKLIFGGMGICIGVILESWGQSDYKGIWVFFKKNQRDKTWPISLNILFTLEAYIFNPVDFHEQFCIYLGIALLSYLKLFSMVPGIQPFQINLIFIE